MNARDPALAELGLSDSGPRPAPPDSTPVARLEAVGLADADGSPALKRLSFALPPGSAHVLTGAPGAGRVLALLGLETRPDSGRVQLFGRDAATLSEGERAAFRRRIGRMFASDRLLEHLTVFENAALVPRIAGRRRADYAGDVGEVLAWLGLAEYADRSPSDLDPPGRRRLGLARALANRPDLLLVEEPSTGLDARGADGVLQRLAECHGAGTTLFMAMGDERQAEKTGAPLLRLAGGTILAVEGFERAGPA